MWDSRNIINTLPTRFWYTLSMLSTRFEDLTTMWDSNIKNLNMLRGELQFQLSIKVFEHVHAWISIFN